MASNLKLSTEEAQDQIKALMVIMQDLTESMKKMKNEGAGSFKKTEAAMNSMGKQGVVLLDQINSLEGVINSNNRALAETEKVSKKAAKSTKEYAQENEKASKSGVKMTRMLGQLMGALGFLGLINMIGKTIKSIISLTIRFESLGFALSKISGDNFAEIKRSWEFLIDLNDKFGASLSDTSERWLKFRAAARQSNLTLTDTMDIFRSVTKASSVLGLSTDELRSVYLALEQMLSKGKVTTEELRRQLGERLPGAMGIMAQAIGVSINELDGMMKKGEILSSYALPRFAKALEEAYGIESLESVENLNTSVGRLTGAWDRFVYTITEGDSAITKLIGGSLYVLTGMINTITNYLETYQQTSNRLSGEVFGDKVAEQLSQEIEFRLKLNETIRSTETALMKQSEASKKAYQEGKGTVDDMLKDQKKLNTFREKNTEKYYQKVVEAEKKILVATIDGSEARIEALRKVNIAVEELENFREKKAEEGNILAIAEGKRAKKQLDDIEKQIAINEENLHSRDARIQKIALASQAVLKAGHMEQLERVKQLNELLKPIGGDTFVEKEAIAARARLVILAKEWEETNKLRINQLNEEIRLNERLAKIEEGNLTGRIDMTFANVEKRREVAALELEDQKKANQLWLDNQDIRLEQNLTRHEGNQKALTKQMEENEKQRATNKRRWQEQEQLAEQAHVFKLKQIWETEEADMKKIMEDFFGRAQSTDDESFAKEVQALNQKLLLVEKGGNEEKRLMLEIEKLGVKYFNLKIDREVSILEMQKQKTDSLEDEFDIQTKINTLLAGKKNDPSLNPDSTLPLVDPLFAQKFSAIASASQEFTNQMVSFQDQIFQNRIDRIDEEIDAETSKYDRLLELAKDDAEETKIIQRNKELALKKLEDKKRKEQIKQAKLDKSLKTSQIITSTAVGIVNQLAQPTPFWVNAVLAGLMAAAGAVQLGTVLNTPIPSFAKGGKMKEDGKALINDGGNQEYVERNGNVLTTGKTNAVVDLKKGDIIHRDFEALKRKSMLLSLRSGGQSISEKEFNMAFGIKEEIKSGFKKARIDNKITVLNETNNYRDKMSLWN